jgi:hypothetical protein
LAGILRAFNSLQIATRPYPRRRRAKIRRTVSASEGITVIRP